MIQQFEHPFQGPIKLGKNPKIVDTRTLQLADYLVPKALPLPPAEVSWIEKVPTPWNMYLNNTLGCCAEAAMAHMVKQMTYFSGRPVVPTDNDVLKAYEAIGDYVPGDPSTDNGSTMLGSLRYWRKTGLAGHKILAFAELNPKNNTELFQAIELFSGIFTGIQLPVTAQSESAWTVPRGGAFGNGSPGSWGGHCIPVLAASVKSRSFVSWGSIMKMSPNFFLDYVDECYVVITPDWIATNGKSPSGLDLPSLLADLKQVTA